MKAPIFSGDALDLRRDPGCHHTPPILNPAPDHPGVFRLICQAKPLTSNSYLLALDRLRVDTPPPTEPGWIECEEAPMPACSGGLTAGVPRFGRFAFFGWGALLLESPAGSEKGGATLTVLMITGPAHPKALRFKGCLGPDQGVWDARVLGCGTAVVLRPGKDAEEVVEWVIPAGGVTVPSPVSVEFACRASGRKAGNTPAKAQLALDCVRAEPGP